jgi:DNA-binding NarL/FixJ family response regulator
MTIRVALVDDQALFRAGIAMLIGSQPDLDVVGEAADGNEVAALVGSCRPDVVLMDVRMSSVDGVTATRELVTTYGDRAPKVLVLTTFDHDEAAASAIEAGASGFVLKGAEPEFLLASVRAVAAGNQVVAASATRALWERFRAPADPHAGTGVQHAHRARTRDPAARRAGPVERRDRGGRGPGRGHREDPHLADPVEARSA